MAALCKAQNKTDPTTNVQPEADVMKTPPKTNTLYRTVTKVETPSLQSLVNSSPTAVPNFINNFETALLNLFHTLREAWRSQLIEQAHNQYTWVYWQNDRYVEIGFDDLIADKPTVINALDRNESYRRFIKNLKIANKNAEYIEKYQGLFNQVKEQLEIDYLVRTFEIYQSNSVKYSLLSTFHSTPDKLLRLIEKAKFLYALWKQNAIRSQHYVNPLQHRPPSCGCIVA